MKSVFFNCYLLRNIFKGNTNKENIFDEILLKVIFFKGKKKFFLKIMKIIWGIYLYIRRFTVLKKKYTKLLQHVIITNKCQLFLLFLVVTRKKNSYLYYTRFDYPILVRVIRKFLSL